MKWLRNIQKYGISVLLTASVCGALLLQLNLLDSELKIQRQNINQNVLEATRGLTNRVGIYLQRQILEQSQGESDSSMVMGIVANASTTMPWETLISIEELDSILVSELSQLGIEERAEWALFENNYLTALQSEGFLIDQATHKVILEDGFFGPQRQLWVHFKGEKWMALGSVQSSLWAALIFSAFILIAYFNVVRQGRKQKRLATVKSDFINNMSHEFKTPLATINLAVDAILKNGEKLTKERIIEYVKIIKQENKRMNAQMESVLQMSMLDKEELTLSFETVDLVNLLRDSVEHFNLTIEERGGLVDVRVPMEKAYVHADHTHLKSAITNLLDNAIKYSLDRPSITVQLQSSGGYFNIVIADKGMGMEDQVRAQIFDRFFRATKGNIHDVKGHGLGLAFVKEIIDKHGGVIDVQSTLGVGTKFTISLPKHSI